MDYIIDAKSKTFGRLTSEIAVVLQGKLSPAYEPNEVSSVRVIIKNWRQFRVTGNKLADKKYYRHTGYMGHLKELSLSQAITKDPRKVILESVRHMLPKNRLNQRRLNKIVFAADAN